MRRRRHDLQPQNPLSGAEQEELRDILDIVDELELPGSPLIPRGVAGEWGRLVEFVERHDLWPGWQIDMLETSEGWFLGSGFSDDLRILAEGRAEDIYWGDPSVPRERRQRPPPETVTPEEAARLAVLLARARAEGPRPDVFSPSMGGAWRALAEAAIELDPNGGIFYLDVTDAADAIHVGGWFELQVEGLVARSRRPEPVAEKDPRGPEP